MTKSSTKAEGVPGKALKIAFLGVIQMFLNKEQKKRRIKWQQNPTFLEAVGALSAVNRQFDLTLLLHRPMPFWAPL